MMWYMHYCVLQMRLRYLLQPVYIGCSRCMGHKELQIFNSGFQVLFFIFFTDRHTHKSTSQKLDSTFDSLDILTDE